MPKFKQNSRIGPYPYRLIKSLSNQGGMSDVYLATDGPSEQATTQPVILKIARIHKDNSDFFEDAIYNESECLRNLHHRGIVRILPVKTANQMRNQTYTARANDLPDAPWFLVLEYLNGGSVDELIQAHQQLAPGLALEIARQVAETLQFMHDHDPPHVHMDIKPENILLRRPLAAGPPLEPVLIDFGVARRVGQTGLEARTLSYAPPERVEIYKENRPPETLAKPHPSMDVYSLGTILYQMLTGRQPFQGRSNQKLSSAILAGNPTAPSRYAKELPPEIEAVILAAMQRDPTRRPSAGEFAQRIAAVQKKKEYRDKFSIFQATPARPRVKLGQKLLVAIPLLTMLIIGVTLFGSGWWAKAAAWPNLPNPFLSFVDRKIAVTATSISGGATVVAIASTPEPTATATIMPTATHRPTSTSLPPTETPTVLPSATETLMATPSEPTIPSMLITPRLEFKPTALLTPMPTRRATSTPLPSATSTATPPPTSTLRPTNSPTALSVNLPEKAGLASKPVAPANSPGSAGPTAVLALSPGSGAGSDNTLTFSWSVDAPLAVGQVYELVFWQEGQPPSDGRAWNEAGTTSTITLKVGAQSPGLYHWGIWLATTRPAYQRLRYLGGGNTVTISGTGGGKPDGGGGSSSGGTGGKSP